MSKRSAPVLALLAALATLVPRAAQACDTAGAQPTACAGVGAYGAVAGLALLVAGADVAFTIHDAARAIQGERASTAVSVAELVVAAPQAYFFTRLAFEDPSTVTVGLAVWTTALTAHALYSLAAPDERVPAPAISLGANAALVPAPGGVGVVGRF
jgi:hypothetical protein